MYKSCVFTINSRNFKISKMEKRLYPRRMPCIDCIDFHECIKNTCSQRKDNCWNQFHPIRLLLWNTRKERPCQQCGKRLPILSQKFQILQTGAGIWLMNLTQMFASEVCSYVVTCNCKEGWRGRCSCATAGLPCTALNICDGKWVYMKTVNTQLYASVCEELLQNGQLLDDNWLCFSLHD